MARVSKDNKVVVTVYSERQETRLAVNRYQPDDANKAVRNQWKQDIASKGYNRRAELLKYSQRLRNSARSPTSPYIRTRSPTSPYIRTRSPASPYIRTPEPTSLKNKQPIARNIAINLACSSFSLVNACGKPKGARFTSCFGNLIQRSYKALTSFRPKKERNKQNQSSGPTSKNVNDNIKSSGSTSKTVNDDIRSRRIRLLKFTCT